MLPLHRKHVLQRLVVHHLVEAEGSFHYLLAVAKTEVCRKESAYLQILNTAVAITVGDLDGVVLQKQLTVVVVLGPSAELFGKLLIHSYLIKVTSPLKNDS